jgi:hypothetical protein
VVTAGVSFGQPLPPATTPWSRSLLRQTNAVGGQFQLLSGVAANGNMIGIGGSILYVTNTGNNVTARRGDPSKPWKDPGEASLVAQEGDTIQIAAGVYLCTNRIIAPTNGVVRGAGTNQTTGTVLFNYRPNIWPLIRPSTGSLISDMCISNIQQNKTSYQACIGSYFTNNCQDPGSTGVVISNILMFAGTDAIYSRVAGEIDWTITGVWSVGLWDHVVNLLPMGVNPAGKFNVKVYNSYFTNIAAAAGSAGGLDNHLFASTNIFVNCIFGSNITSSTSQGVVGVTNQLIYTNCTVHAALDGQVIGAGCTVSKPAYIWSYGGNILPANINNADGDLDAYITCVTNAVEAPEPPGYSAPADAYQLNITIEAGVTDPPVHQRRDGSIYIATSGHLYIRTNSTWAGINITAPE